MGDVIHHIGANGRTTGGYRHLGNIALEKQRRRAISTSMVM
jgi:hypothetical protein